MKNQSYVVHRAKLMRIRRLIVLPEEGTKEYREFIEALGQIYDAGFQDGHSSGWREGARDGFYPKFG